MSLVIDGVLTDFGLDSPLPPGSATTISFSSLEEGESHCVTITLPSGQKSTECISDCDYEEGCSGFVFTISEVIVS